jgi:hypothetical protein
MDARKRFLTDLRISILPELGFTHHVAGDEAQMRLEVAATYLIRYADRSYTLDPRSAFRRGFVLLDGSRHIGSIEPTSAFTRGAMADLPDTWPLPCAPSSSG